MKQLEDSTEGIIQDIGLDKDFFDNTPKAQETNTEIDKLDFIKLK
jgi:hypothetical protein